MTILRYTPEVQKQLGSKTKPEPWLHVCMQNDMYAIYVWDTRQILESGKYRFPATGPIANDNRMPLVGQDSDKFVFEDKHAKNAHSSELSNVLTSAIKRAENKYERTVNQLFEDSIIQFMPAEFLKNVDAKQLTEAMNKRVVADCKRRQVKSPNFFELKLVEQAIDKYKRKQA